MNIQSIKLFSVKIFLLTTISLVLSACSGPIKNTEVQEKISKDIPPFLKIKEFKLGETSEQQNSIDGWFVEAPFELKLEFADNTYVPSYKRFDYADKTKTILFIKDKRKKGEILDFSGIARMNYEKINSGKIVQNLSVEIKKFFPTDYGKTISEFEKDYSKAYPVSSEDAKNWGKGYEDVIKRARQVLPGEWDNGIYYADDGLCILTPKGNSAPIERRWDIDSKGFLTTYESGTTKHTNDLLVSVSDNELTFQDMGVSEKSVNLEDMLYLKTTLTVQKKTKDIAKLKDDAVTYAKNLLGVWNTNWYKNGAVGIIKDDGTLIFSNKNADGSLSGLYEKGTWKFIDDKLQISIDETERGKSEWKRYFRVILADGKNFEIQQVRNNGSDNAPKYKGELIRTISEQAEYEKKRSEALSEKIRGKWQWHISKGIVKAPGLANTRYPYDKPELDVFSTFEENGSFTHSFFFKPGRNGSYYPANTYRGSWEVHGEILVLNLTEKDGKGIPVETYKYNIFEKKNSSNEALFMSPSGQAKGIMNGTLYRSKIGAEGPLAPQSRGDKTTSMGSETTSGVSSEERIALSKIQSLIDATNAVIKLNSQLESEKNASLAAQKARGMKEKNIPDLERKLSDTKRYLLQNTGKIGQKNLSSITKSIRECENSILSIKQNLAKYSTLKEGVDNIKDLGNKILNLF